ncbi:hypothetical protein EJB05_11941, partial [Eragrostis curvula]
MRFVRRGTTACSSNIAKDTPFSEQKTMARTNNKAFLCFWLLTLLALSSEEVVVSWDADCNLIFHPFCKHDSDCDGPCEKEADPINGYNNIIGKCRNLSCFCCPPPRGHSHNIRKHTPPHGHNHSIRKLAR